MGQSAAITCPRCRFVHPRGSPQNALGSKNKSFNDRRVMCEDVSVDLGQGDDEDSLAKPMTTVGNRHSAEIRRLANCLRGSGSRGS
jgi:hypothetical protein